MDADPTPTPAPQDWPAALRIPPGAVVVLIGCVVALAWAAFAWVDLLDMVERGDRFKPVWEHLFNDRPVEWTQWFLLPATAVTSAYLAGRLHGIGERRPAAFFFLFGIGTALMLIEDAGDIRHVLSEYVAWIFGEEPVAGLPARVVSDVPYLALMAAVPIYALLRYGRDAWRAPRARPFLVVGFSFYALAGGASGIRHLADFYIRVGRWIDAWLLGGRFPPGQDLTQDRSHFLLVDSLLEESVEAIAAACFLAVVLAFVADLRAGRLEPERGSAPDPSAHSIAKQ